METVVILVNIWLTESTVCSIQQPKLSKICLLWLPVNQNSNGTDDSLLRALHGGGSPPGGTLAVQPSSIPMLSSCFNKLFSMLQVHHVQVRTSSFHFCITSGLRVNYQFFFFNSIALRRCTRFLEVGENSWLFFFVLMKTFFLLQLESLLQLWLTLSLNTTCGSSEESGSDIFLFNASRVPTIPLNQGQKSCQKLLLDM